MKKLLAAILAALVVVGAAVAAGWTFWAPSQAAVEPPTVAVTRGTVEQTVLASGALEARSVTSVGAEVSGRIQTLAVKLGDVVDKGALIAEIDSVDQENAVKSAEASLANMRAQLSAKQADLKTAQAALERADKLKAQSLLSTADQLTAEANLASAQAAIASLEAQISQAELAVDAAKLNLERTKITAPVGGTVVAVLVSAGQSVNAAQSAPTIVKIADLDTMLIKAQISEADITRVAPGQSASFTILGDPNTKIDATLLSLEPAPDAITTADNGLSGSDNAVYYNGIFSVPNPGHRLRIAMTARVTIVIDAARDVLTLPAAVLGSADRRGIYHVGVYDPATGKVHPAEVKAGLTDNITTQIVDGLAEGDKVVTGAPVHNPAAAQGGGQRGGGVFGGGGRPVLIGRGG